MCTNDTVVPKTWSVVAHPQKIFYLGKASKMLDSWSVFSTCVAVGTPFDAGSSQFLFLMLPWFPPPPFEDVAGEDHQNAGNVTPPVCVLEDNGEDRDGAESGGTVFYSIP